MYIDAVTNGQVFDFSTLMGMAIGAFLIMLVTAAVVTLIIVVWKTASKTRKNRHKVIPSENYYNTIDGGTGIIKLKTNGSYEIPDVPTVPKRTDNMDFNHNISYNATNTINGDTGNIKFKTNGSYGIRDIPEIPKTTDNMDMNHNISYNATNTINGDTANIKLNGNRSYGIHDVPAVLERTENVDMNYNISYSITPNLLEESDEHEYIQPDEMLCDADTYYDI